MQIQLIYWFPESERGRPKCTGARQMCRYNSYNMSSTWNSIAVNYRILLLAASANFLFGDL